MSLPVKTEHYEMVLKAGDMERAMPRLAWHLEEPRVGQSYPNFYAAQLASKFVKVVLSGSRRRRAVRRLSVALLPRRRQRRLRALRRQVLRLLAAADPEQDDPASSSRRSGSDVDDVWTRDIFRDVFPTTPTSCARPEDYVNHSLYFEAKTFLHGLLVVEDKLSMAHGLETRVPFLDNDLVDFAMRVPVRLKLGNLGEVVRLNENEPGPKTEQVLPAHQRRQAAPAQGDGALRSRPK